jgi:peptidoglycan hydrolase-like protein with peptidoglycan-binding domain
MKRFDKKNVAKASDEDVISNPLDDFGLTTALADPMPGETDSIITTDGNITAEKNESFKQGMNNTGYIFSSVDGKILSTSDVFAFINKQKAEGAEQFLQDFSDTSNDPLIFEISGSKYQYYEYSFTIEKDPLKDDKNLKSKALRGINELELTHDGLMVVGLDSTGPYVIAIQKALNLIHSETTGYIPLEEQKDFGPLTKAAVIKFQVSRGLKGQNGVVGKETIRQLDKEALDRENILDYRKAEDDYTKKLSQERERNKKATQKAEYKKEIAIILADKPDQLQQMNDYIEHAYANNLPLPTIKEIKQALSENSDHPNAGGFYKGVKVPSMVGATAGGLFDLLPDGFIPKDNSSWDAYGTYVHSAKPSYELPKDSRGNYIEKETYKNSFFYANDKITTTNITAIIVSGFIAGTGPENYVFLENHAVSKTVMDAYIVKNKLEEWYKENSAAILSGGKLNSLDKHSTFGVKEQAGTAASWTTGSMLSIENLLGSAKVTIVPNKATNELYITVYNVTSKGSGHYEKDLPAMTGLKESEAHSYPRSPDVPYQMYSNVSQTFHYTMKIDKSLAEKYKK